MNVKFKFNSSVSLTRVSLGKLKLFAQWTLYVLCCSKSIRLCNSLIAFKPHFRSTSFNFFTEPIGSGPKNIRIYKEVAMHWIHIMPLNKCRNSVRSECGQERGGVMVGLQLESDERVRHGPHCWPVASGGWPACAWGKDRVREMNCWTSSWLKRIPTAFNASSLTFV